MARRRGLLSFVTREVRQFPNYCKNACSGNQCCPGVPETQMLTYPRPHHEMNKGRRCRFGLCLW